MTKEAPADPGADLGFTLRSLARAARAGSLATITNAGQPFVSLVTPAFDAGCTPLLLLSGLSEHTRHLRVEPRCALLITGAANGPNPQTTPRVTLIGCATPIEDAALRARYLAIHPYAALYAGFGDFALWRLTVEEAHYVGGFGLARHVTQAKLLPAPEAVAAIAAAEPEIIAEANAERAVSERIVAIDLDGCDIAEDDATRRLTFPAPAASPETVRAALRHVAPQKTRGARPAQARGENS